MFYDYSSLYQFRRAEGSREDAEFKKALEAMHIMYSTDDVATLRIVALETFPGHVMDQDLFGAMARDAFGPFGLRSPRCSLLTSLPVDHYLHPCCRV